MTTNGYKANPKFASDFLNNSDPLKKALLTEAEELKGKIRVGSDRAPLSSLNYTTTKVTSSAAQGCYISKPRAAGVIAVHLKKADYRKKYIQAVKDAIRRRESASDGNI